MARKETAAQVIAGAQAALSCQAIDEALADYIAQADYDTYCRWMRSVSDGRPNVKDFDSLSVAERQTIYDIVSRWDDDTIEIRLYRLSGNWIWVDDLGVETNLGCYLQTKNEVRRHIRSYLASRNPNDSRRVKFAWD